MATTDGSTGRGFYIGLAIGQIWLSAINTSFVSLLWILGQNAAQAVLILAGVTLVGVILISSSIILLRNALRLPADASPEIAVRSKARGRKIGLLFGVVFLAEAVIIGILDAILGQTGHGDWDVPVTYFIVGLHFIPLAFVFHVRPYVVLGFLWVIITFLTVLLFPANQVLAQGVTFWVFFPIAGCGLATWAIVAYILWRNMRSVRQVMRLPLSA